MDLIASTFSYRFGKWVVAHKWLVILLSIAFIGVATAGAKGLILGGDYRIFFKPDNPQLQAFDALQKTYTKSENVLLVLEPKDGKVFTPSTLAAVVELTNQAWKLSYSSRVDSISNYQYSSADGDTVSVHDFIRNPEKLGRTDLMALQEIAVKDPLLVKRLISRQAHVTGINVTVQLPDQNKVPAIRKIVDEVGKLKQKFEVTHPDIKVHLTGVVMMNSAFMEATRTDLRKLVPIMLVVVLAVLMLTLRSFAATALIALSIVLSIAATMGLAGWTGVVLSAPVAMAPLTVLIMAVADGVHVLSHYGRGMAGGLRREDAMIESLGATLPSMLLTNLLSALGYLAMNFSDVPPYQTLGNVVAAGIAIGFLLSVLLVPALAMVLPAKLPQRVEQKVGILVRYQEFFLVHRNRFLIASLALTMGVGYFITKLDFNDSFHEYFDRSTEFRKASEFAMNNLTGVYMMDYSLSAGDANSIHNPEFLRKVEDFVDWYRLQPEVEHVSTVTDVLKRLNKNMHGDDPLYYRLPESRELAAQYLVLYELSLPYGLDLTNQINMDKSATRITVVLKAVKSAQMIALEKRAAQWLEQHGDGVLQTPGAAGAGLMFAHIGQKNNKSMMVGNVYQIVFISFLIIFAIRSLALGILSLVPNLTPAIIAYGVWGLTVGEVNMGVSIVGGISLGIVVDDTIYFLSKYLHARRTKQLGPEDAVRYAFEFAGIPMWISTFTLVAGFLVLATSPFAMNSDMGVLTAATVGLAALTEICMLPALLLLVDRPRGSGTLKVAVPKEAKQEALLDGI